MTSYDALIVGAGFSGAVMAERLASQLGWKVLLIEQRNHIGGNCFDYYDEHGVLIHRYGPHLFHTDKKEVWDYLSQFTDWHPYQHKVLTHINGQFVPLPFNLNSIDLCFSPERAQLMTAALLERFGPDVRVPILKLRKESNPLLSELAHFIYYKVFLNYTTKQWGVGPDKISPEVTARVPVVTNRDDHYFTDPYQAIPAKGYSKLFERILAHPKISLQLNTSFSKIAAINPSTGKVILNNKPHHGITVFTGMIDELFQYKHGDLPYRSLRFDFQHHESLQFQPATVVNYPNEHNYTRITEFKHLTGQKCQGTTIVYEYPQNFDPNDPDANVPYYPMFNDSSRKTYEKYSLELENYSNIYAIGRLAQYRYFDMDDAIANALTTFERIQQISKLQNNSKLRHVK